MTMWQHGSYDIIVRSNVLYLKFWGSSNKEAVEAFDEEYRRLITPQTDKPWAAFVDFTEWELVTPEAMPRIQEHIAWCVDHNQRAGVYLVKESVLFIELLSQMAKNVKFPPDYHFLRTESFEEAESWLKDLNYDFNIATAKSLTFR